MFISHDYDDNNNNNNSETNNNDNNNVGSENDNIVQTVTIYVCQRLAAVICQISYNCPVRRQSVSKLSYFCGRMIFMLICLLKINNWLRWLYKFPANNITTYNNLFFLQNTVRARECLDVNVFLGKAFSCCGPFSHSAVRDAWVVLLNGSTSGSSQPSAKPFSVKGCRASSFSGPFGTVTFWAIKAPPIYLLFYSRNKEGALIDQKVTVPNGPLRFMASRRCI